MTHTQRHRITALGLAFTSAIAAMAAPARDAHSGPPSLLPPYVSTETVYRPDCPRDGCDRSQENCDPGT